jgi:4-hydroxybenzoate polyprenyltransferase
MRLDKPIGIFLLLWPSLMAIWFASNGHINLKILTIFVSGVIVMRSAGCVINDFADRNVDSKVSRTKNRPLATKQVTPQSALLLFIFLLSLAFILVLNLNFFSILLSCIAAILAILYPFCKRFIAMPQGVLGLAFAWAIPMAYAAINNHLSLETWILFLASVCWTIAYDTQYAMADKEDDLKIGIKSSAILFGKFDKQIVFSLQLIFIFSLTYLSISHHLYFFSLLAQAVAIILVVKQQDMLHAGDPENCLRAFLQNNSLGAVLFCGICLDFLFKVNF